MKILVFGIFLISTVHCREYWISAPYYQEAPYYVSDFEQPYANPLTTYYSESEPNPVPLPYGSYYSFPYSALRTSDYDERMDSYQFRPTYSNKYYKTQRPKVKPLSAQTLKTKSDKYKVSVNKNTGVSENGTPVFTEDIQIVSRRKNTPSILEDDFNKRYYNEECPEHHHHHDEAVPLCLSNKLYRYFQPFVQYPTTYKKPHCNSHSTPHPNERRSPITILPETFSPTIEQILEKLQNYFSTYSELETIKPQTQQTTSALPPTKIEPPSTQEESNKITTEESKNFNEFESDKGTTEDSEHQESNAQEEELQKSKEEEEESQKSKEQEEEESQKSKEEEEESSEINQNEFSKSEFTKSEFTQSAISQPEETLSPFDDAVSLGSYPPSLRSDGKNKPNTESKKNSEVTTKPDESKTKKAENKAQTPTTEAIKTAEATTTEPGNRAATTTTEAGKGAATTTTEAGKRAATTTTEAGKRDATTTTEAGKRSVSTTTEAGKRASATTATPEVVGQTTAS